MNYSRLTLAISFLLASASVGLVANALHATNTVAAQSVEKSLLIERHGNEPLELMELKIGDESVHAKIQKKFRSGDDGYDVVSAPSDSEWSKHIRIRLRNVSGKVITGFQAYLYFKPSEADVLFAASLT